ncbi:hypothetical protein ABN222_19420, partial [Providencia alcalifaciens]
DIHQGLLKTCGDQTVDVSTVRWWVVCFSSGGCDMRDKLHSRWTCTAVMVQNEEGLDQLICANPWIMTRELCTDLDIGVSALETMVAMLEYHKVCSRWVPHMETTPHASGPILNQHKAEGDSFLDCIITGDKTWCHHYELEAEQQYME